MTNTWLKKALAISWLILGGSVAFASVGFAFDEKSPTEKAKEFKHECDANPTMKGNKQKICTCLALTTQAKDIERSELLGKLKDPAATLSSSSKQTLDRCASVGTMNTYRKQCDLEKPDTCRA